MGLQMTSQNSRVGLAVEQLHVAIDLFLTDRSHAAALTLAGAAEVILAQLAERFGERPTLDRQYEVVATLLTASKHPAPSKKEFFKQRNALRNQLKHFDALDSEWLEGNCTQGAIQMLGRACNNYELCGLPPTEPMMSFYGWYYGQGIDPSDEA